MRSMLKTGVAVAVVVALAGCASTQKSSSRHQPDNSPQNPTIVMHADYYFNGAFIPEHSGKQVVHTRHDRRRLDHDTRYRSITMRWANSHTGQIARVDEDLSYRLDHRRKQYQECPLAGCRVTHWLDSLKSDDGEEEYQSYEELGCTMTMASNEFSVVKTGQRRVISQVEAEEYKVSWKTVLQDDAAKKDTNLVQMVFWTTTPDAEVQNAWRVQRQFHEQYLDKTEDNVLTRLLGRDAYMALGAISGDIENTDAEQYNGFLKEMATIQGFPLSIKLEWYRDVQACQEQRKPKARNAGVDLSGGLGRAARSMVSGVVQQQRERLMDEWMKKPVFHYLYDVTSLKEEAIHDSIFAPPAGYQLTDRQ